MRNRNVVNTSIYGFGIGELENGGAMHVNYDVMGVGQFWVVLE